jgi:heptosyltransferase-2
MIRSAPTCNHTIAAGASSPHPLGLRKASPYAAVCATFRRQPIRRVLVRAPNWLGDVVMALPALDMLRRRFPDAHLAVMLRPHLAPLLEGLPWIDALIPHRHARGLASFASRHELARKLEVQRFDLAVLLTNSLGTAFDMAWARIPRRLGFAREGRSFLLTDAVAAPGSLRAQHQSDQYAALLAPLRPPARRDVPLTLSAEAEKQAQELLSELPAGGPLVAFAPGAAYGPAKQWPAEHFAWLGRLLHADYGARIVLSGAPHEKALCARIAEEMGGDVPTLNTAGRDNVAVAAAIYAACDAFVGNDSGASHVAAAAGTPTVAVFGSTRPTLGAPKGRHTGILYLDYPCSPCRSRTCPSGHYRCLWDVTPESVQEALRVQGACRRA